VTLLTYNSKYIVQSASTVTTSSSTLANDTQATLTFSLASTKTVLIIYTANSAYSRTNGVGGIKNAINIDNTDVSQMNDSGYAANNALRNSCIWVGALGSGSHTINGRLASAVNAQTTTVDNRTLLIYVFNGNEFAYIDDTTTQTASATTYIDDSYATTTFTPSSDCKALVFYAITNLKGSTERYTGKKICINIAGEDKDGEAAKSSNSAVTSPDSLATVYAQSLTAVGTTITGRLATNTGTQTVTADRHVLGVLLFDPSVVLDLVASVTPVSSTSTALVNDNQAPIARTRSTTSELLILGQATKQNGTTGSMYGLAYGLNVDGVDVALSRSSPAYTSDAESSFVVYASTEEAASHTINGRFATNAGTSAAVVSTRVLIALWFPLVTLIQTTSSISGVGSSTASLSNINRINSTVLGVGSQTSNLIAQDAIYSPPTSLTANFSGTPLTGYLPLTVQFTDSSTVPTSIVDNSDFEAGLPANTLGAYTPIVQSGTYKRHGVYSMRVIATSAVSDCYFLVNHDVLGLIAGTQYYWEIYVYSPDGATIYPGAMFLQGSGGVTAAGAINGNSAPQSLPAGAWVKMCGTGTTGSDWNELSRLVLRPGGDAGPWDTAHYIYYDDLKVYPITWAWTFGDTATASTQNPSHQYTTKGVYDVGLTVTIGSPSNLKTSTSYVTVNELLNISTSSTGSGSVTSALASLNKSVTGSASGGGTLTSSTSLNKIITSSLSGVGSETSALSTNQSITGIISGGGSSTADQYIIEYITSSIGGGGLETANPTLIWYITSTMSGEGSETSNVIKYNYITSSVMGGGSETAIINELKQITSSISAGASQTLNPLTFGQIRSIITATCVLTANANLISGTVDLSSLLFGSGSETANPIEFKKIISNVTGLGVGTASDSLNKIIASSIDGGGSSSANLIEFINLLSSVLGLASETANIISGGINVSVSSTLSGGGSQTTLASLNKIITFSISGGGTTAANLIEWNYLSSDVSGGGSSTANPTLVEYIASTISSTGSITAALSLNKIVSSIAAGGGNTTANTFILEMLNSAVLGVGRSSAHITYIALAVPHFNSPLTLMIDQKARTVTIFQPIRTVILTQ